jgi:hypothetical protein
MLAASELEDADAAVDMKVEARVAGSCELLLLKVINSTSSVEPSTARRFRDSSGIPDAVTSSSGIVGNACRCTSA